ncbi:MAG: winged helix-turn-helix domain-containing protein [Acidimicrobiales bacterium]
MVTVGAAVRLGEVELVTQGNLLIGPGHCYALSARELAVLEVLAARQGAVVSRSALLKSVWGPGMKDAHVVDVTVSRLRRRLGPLGAFVKTRQSRGYWLEEA